MSFYDHDSEKMFNEYMAATKELMGDTGITNIIPSGTAVMNLRASYLNTTDANDFTRDGYHMSFGAGRYAAACVFFEYFITPRYGISVLGNLLRLSGFDHPVTDENAEFIQKCAVEAVQHPFTVNTQLGPAPAPKRKLIGGIKDVLVSQAGRGIQENFNRIIHPDIPFIKLPLVSNHICNFRFFTLETDAEFFRSAPCLNFSFNRFFRCGKVLETEERKQIDLISGFILNVEFQSLYS